jgi:hypothetical protein
MPLFEQKLLNHQSHNEKSISGQTLTERVGIEPVNNHNFPLLITATIRPHAGQIGRLLDPVTRRRQYAGALRSLAVRPCGIKEFVFCENSGEPFPEFASIQELFSRNNLVLHFFQEQLSSEDKIPGKGWGEGWLIGRVLETNLILKRAKGFFKLTGRYKVVNLKAVVACIGRAYSDPTAHPVFVCQSYLMTSRGPYVDSQFFWAQTEFYKQNLVDVYTKVDDHGGVYLEHAIGSGLHALAGQCRIGVLPFTVILKGVSGHSSEPVSNPRQRFRLMMSNITRNKSGMTYLVPTSTDC